MLGDEAEDVDESAESEEEESGACDYWDYLAECRDGPGCVLLWCARCGNRPRGAHYFRCRLHDDTLSNGHTRPTPPSPPSDEAAEKMNAAAWVRAMEAHDDALATYKEALDRWSPQWLLLENAAEPPEPSEAFPLPCVRCRGPTELGGSGTKVLSTSYEMLRVRTPWLPAGYLTAGDGEVRVVAGSRGTCVRCQLIVAISPDD